MNVLLLNPPYLLSQDSVYSKTGAVLPPLGILYIADYVRKKHPDIYLTVLDAPAYQLDLETFTKRIETLQPDIVGITVYTTTFLLVCDTVKIIKELFPECIVVAGGPHVSVLPEESLNIPGVDIAVTGEGEQVFADLIECLKQRSKLDKIPNIFYKHHEQIVRTPLRTMAIDLDTIRPARDLVEMPRYRPAMGTFKRLPSTNMITSRGCPFHCYFCSKEVFGSNYRMQSITKIVAEIEMLIHDYQIKEVIFNDDVFTLDQERTEAFCDRLIEKKFDLTWSCSTRVNLINQRLLEKMKRSGCVSVGYGIESGDPEILRIIQKGVTLEKAAQAVRWTKEAGIETRAYYIFGFPGETQATLQRTLDFALTVNADFVIFNLAIPLPGTPLYKEAKAKGMLLYDGVELYQRTDGPHPLIRLEHLSDHELMQFYQHAYKRYYFRPRYIVNQLRNIKTIDDVKRYLTGLVSFISWLR